MSEDLTQPIITESRKTPIIPILFTIFLVVLISIAGFFGYQNFLMHKQIAKLSIQPVPTPIPTIPVDPTANWKTYTNTKYNFSFKYPSSFSTEILAAGGQNEADSNSRNFFVYQTGANRKYEERYLNFEVTQIEPNYQGTITQSTLNGISAKKITLLNIQFDIYSIKLSSGEFIEIYVSNNVNKKDVVDQILSTFKFIEPSASPTPQISYVRPEISDTSSWKVYTLKNIQFKAPQEARVSITDGDAVITLPESVIPSANIMLRTYSGGSRREWWIKEINATSDEVSKYMRFQDVMLGGVAALDVFSDGGWWQGGYASPILIAKGKTIIAVHGGRGLNPETGKTSRYIFSDSVASTIKFIQ